MRYFDVEPRVVPLKLGNYRLTAEQLEKYVDENTICVVAIAGQTFTGEDDDLQEIHDWLDDYEERTGISIPMHVDGASGGLVNPFLYPEYKWDFRLPRVQSINVSGHKYGLVPPGLGWVIFRERGVFNEELVFYVNYLGGEAPTATLNFSKGSATVLMQYYMFLRFGRSGYTRIMRYALDHAIYLRDRLIRTGKFQIMNHTQRIPVVALTIDKSAKRYNEFDVSNKVRETATDTPESPWYVVKANNKRQARLNCIAHFLSIIPYTETRRAKVTLPHRQKAKGYVEPDYPYRFVPEKF